MLIRDQDIQVTTNFNMRELYSTSVDAPDEHYLDDRVIAALQYIRTLSGSPIRVTSTYRTPFHNSVIGGASNSQHLVSRAIDFQWITDNEEELTRLHTEMNRPNSQLKQALYNLGVRGFGYYETFCHIDTRIQDGWTTWGDDNAMIDQDGITGYTYDVVVGTVKKNLWPLLAGTILILLAILIYRRSTI